MKWASSLKWVMLSGVIFIQACFDGSGSIQHEATASASNLSKPTACAEDDNVNIPLVSASPLRSFTIEATHPTYNVGQDNCAANFDNCPPPAPGYSFSPAVVKLFDDGETIVEAVREAEWWLPTGMEASVDDGSKENDVHYVRVYKKIAGSNGWPQVFVLYMDGNLRLIPQPPVGSDSVCFGSSVIVGPAATSARPYAEIRSVRYISLSDQLQVSYEAGGNAVISFEEISRSISQVSVAMNYAGDLPFATFRSMYVEKGNSDVDTIDWVGASGQRHSSWIMDFPGGDGTEWFFYRQHRSDHNTSAPNITISNFVAGN